LSAALSKRRARRTALAQGPTDNKSKTSSQTGRFNLYEARSVVGSQPAHFCKVCTL
jgi:hypothetical protein